MPANPALSYVWLKYGLLNCGMLSPSEEGNEILEYLAKASAPDLFFFFFFFEAEKSAAGEVSFFFHLIFFGREEKKKCVPEGGGPGARAGKQALERLGRAAGGLEAQDEVVGGADQGVGLERGDPLRGRRDALVLRQQVAVDDRGLLGPELERAQAVQRRVKGRPGRVGKRRDLVGDGPVGEDNRLEAVRGAGELGVFVLDKVHGGVSLFLEVLEGLGGERVLCFGIWVLVMLMVVVVVRGEHDKGRERKREKKKETWQSKTKKKTHRRPRGARDEHDHEERESERALPHLVLFVCRPWLLREKLSARRKRGRAK